MATHVQVLAVLHICLGCLGLLMGLLGFLLFGGIAAVVGVTADPPDSLAAVPVLGIIGVAALLLFLVLSLPSLIAGIGLLRFRPWARPVGIIVSALSLLNFPFGTAVGVYGLWVLLSSGIESCFERRPVQAFRQPTGL